MSSKRVMVQPINVIFKHLQAGARVSVWLYDNTEQRIEGKIIGFDEFMNVVLDEAEEVWLKETKTKKVGDKATLGRLLLKGENITLIQPASA
ncbi:putative small nuclear ribonucleo protein E [Leucosporidium creatinivorum]|uniref:Small nuclear ribonucleoprotein E n=1 Tax=Leucosporidium creatinivorum TaxID=106004 RepID=A0A1Y2FWD6_9BASI|nr:putative small nuclear ribonucleo protein E [Leucosporidium creatinivorum]